MTRGEIWIVNLDPTVGPEIRKTRPVIIVNDDSIGILPLKVIVPITEWKENYSISPWMIRIDTDETNGLDKLSAADTFQLRSIAQSRFVRSLGNLSDETMKKIGKALALVLGL